jgi:endonuclease YncB( thermonuclease family)
MGATPAVLLIAALFFGAVLDSSRQVGAPVPASTGDASVIEATVSRAIDGASLDAYVDGRRTAVGYLGIEAPPANQPCGREALNRNRELAGSQVRLVEDPGYQFDEMGRRLAYAFTSDGQSIEEILVREGLARAARTDASRGSQLAALQAEAEADGRGCLWSGAASAG